MVCSIHSAPRAEATSLISDCPNLRLLDVLSVSVEIFKHTRTLLFILFELNLAQDVHTGTPLLLAASSASASVAAKCFIISSSHPAKFAHSPTCAPSPFTIKALSTNILYLFEIPYNFHGACMVALEDFEVQMAMGLIQELWMCEMVPGLATNTQRNNEMLVTFTDAEDEFKLLQW